MNFAATSSPGRVAGSSSASSSRGSTFAMRVGSSNGERAPGIGGGRLLEIGAEAAGLLRNELSSASSTLRVGASSNGRGTGRRTVGGFVRGTGGGAVGGLPRIGTGGGADGGLPRIGAEGFGGTALCRFERRAEFACASPTTTAG